MCTLSAVLARAAVVVALALLLSVSGEALAAQETRGSTDPASLSGVAFVDVNVIPMDREQVIEGQTVLVRDGRIAEIGPAASVEVPADAIRVDGAGKYLMPGLAEMHAHIPGTRASAGFVEDVLFLYLANGITTIRGMLGHPDHLVLRGRAARGELWSPQIYTSGPSFNGNSVPSPEAAERMVAEQKAAGYDLLKVHPGVPRNAYDAMAAAAHRLEIPFAGHIPEEVGLRRAMEAGQASVDHLDGYPQLLLADDAANEGVDPGFFGMNLTPHLDPSKIPAVAAATREAGVWNVPTQSLIEHLASPDSPEAMAERPEMRYMPRQMVEGWMGAKRNLQSDPDFDPEAARRFVEIRRALIKGLHDAGAGLLLGSDAPQIFNVPGFSIHHELSMLVAAGLTPYQAIETGTRNPAVYFAAPGEFGTVEAGKRADLILLDANPLEDVGNIARRAGVMVGGRWLPESEIQQRLEAIADGVAGAERD